MIEEKCAMCHFTDDDLNYPIEKLFENISQKIKDIFSSIPNCEITKIMVSRNVYNALANNEICVPIIDDHRHTIKINRNGSEVPVEIYAPNMYCYELAFIYYINRNKSSIFDHYYYYNIPHSIEKIIYRDPATIVLWSDGTKTVVKCQEGDTYDKEKGFLLCFVKKVLGNSSRNLNYILKGSQKVIECEIPDKKKGKKDGKKSERKPKNA